jgi:hypothetical protein
MLSRHVQIGLTSTNGKSLVKIKCRSIISLKKRIRAAPKASIVSKSFLVPSQNFRSWSQRVNTQASLRWQGPISERTGSGTSAKGSPRSCDHRTKRIGTKRRKDHEEMMVVGERVQPRSIQIQKESSHGVHGGHGRCPALDFLAIQLYSAQTLASPL